jgi:predicted Zn-dependent peptidase
MLFKGTPERTALQIAQAVEGRGGHLNAFTDKQATCYYARVLSEDSAHAVDVLGDMVVNSLIDEAELEKEKQVVIEEIKRGEDEPSDHVHDLHLESRWAGHPLGRPIIGTRESVSSFSRQNLQEYMDRRYRGGRLLAVAAGRIDHDAFVEAVQERLGGAPSGEGEAEMERPSGTAGFRHEEKPVEQMHFCIGTDAPALEDEDHYTAGVLNDLLGGGMMSRLFQEIREKRGLVYSIGSYGLSYQAGGALTIYGGCSPAHWEEVQSVVRAELDKLMLEAPPEEEIERSRKSVLGSLMLAQESMSSRMMRLGRGLLFRGRAVPLEEVQDRIKAVDAGAALALAKSIFSAERMNTTVIGPGR